MPVQTREIRLAARPSGWPDEGTFELAEVTLADPGEGELLVRTDFMSVDPYMRGRMNDTKSYVPPFQVGQPLEGGAVGHVVASRAEGFAEGDVVLHGLGWREHAVVPAGAARRLDPAQGVPLSVYLGVLGMPGLTAYVGLLDIAAMKEGDAVFVSGAAGAVGSLVGQLARLKGASRVVGSAGSPAKVQYLKELGFDAAFDYHDGSVTDLLDGVAPEGIDVYFENVGGDHLEAALAALRPYGRVAMCGAISQYNATEPAPGPRNMFQAIGKRLTLRGFIVSDHSQRTPDLIREVGGWVQDGSIRFQETVVDGVEHAPKAFLGLLRGENTGKMVVRLGG